jgi:hypothetical protein
MIHVLSRTEQEGVRFCPIIQNVKKFKIYELFIFGIFYLIFSDDGWPKTTEFASVRGSSFLLSLPLLFLGLLSLYCKDTILLRLSYPLSLYLLSKTTLFDSHFSVNFSVSWFPLPPCILSLSLISLLKWDSAEKFHKLREFSIFKCKHSFLTNDTFTFLYLANFTIIYSLIHPIT